MPALRDVLYSGQISEGPPVRAFEAGFADLVGARHVSACSSGTAALHLALAVAGVGPGDEVVSTAMTAEPTNMAIRHAGADVRWADVDPRNGNVTADPSPRPSPRARRRSWSCTTAASRRRSRASGASPTRTDFPSSRTPPTPSAHATAAGRSAATRAS